MSVDSSLLIAIILGNGAVVTIGVGLISHAYSYYQHKSEKDFDARKVARDYYMTLYARIGTLDEMAKSYRRSLKNDKKAKVFLYKEGKFAIHTSDEILEDFKNAYVEFYSYYLQNASEGYEIFVSKRLQDQLFEFWRLGETFNDNNQIMKNEQEIEKFSRFAEKTTNYMEKLFGLN